MEDCSHTHIELANPYEILRKYRCLDCGGIMTCACEQEFGLKFLPNQLKFTTDQQSRDKIPVTLGSVANVCNNCRGLPEPAFPAHSHYGSSSKIKRYYWREIFKDTRLRYAEWCNANNEDYSKPGHHKTPDYQRIEKEVIEFWKAQHKAHPKYVYNDLPPSAVLEECEVKTVDFEGQYIKGAGKDKPLLDSGIRYSPEEFVARKYKQQGWKTEFMESIPLQALFGVLAWLWVQDGVRDPKLRIIGFGGRDGIGADARGMIWTQLPPDFGSNYHFKRREEDFRAQLKMMGHDKADMLWAFDYWAEPSRALRQYLWAYKDDDLRRARLLVEVLPLETVKAIVTYLAEHYWERYLGWPDLFLWKEDSSYMFVEVKGSRDKLSVAQQNWIRGNHSQLSLPFELAKIHKARIIEL